MKKSMFLLIAATLLRAEDDSPERLGWPRMLEADGCKIVVFQPQIEAWDDKKRRLELQMALSCSAEGSEEAHVASIRIRARTDVDFAERTVEISRAKIDSLDFPGADPEAVAKFRKVIRARLDDRTWTQSLERMLALAARPEGGRREVPVSTLAPPVYYSEADAVLVQYMGQPAFEKIPGTKLQYAVNTNWDVLSIDGAPGTWLLLGEGWIKTKNIAGGPWEPAGELPDEFRLLPKDDNWSAVRAHVPGRPVEAVPEVFVSFRPAELVLVDGERRMATIDGTAISYVLNSDEDLFRHGDRWYLLVAGRWFETGELKSLASWQAVRDLPDDFARIPADHEMAEVRAMVPGTPECEEAALQASIPRTAGVKREGATIEVTWDGDPEFEEIEGTGGVAYGVNTPYDVFSFEGRYYGCENGVWFEAPSPQGEWTLCEKVPQKIYGIPGEHPKHNCTYVEVYDADEDEVVYGYTAGYYGVYYWRRRIWFGYGYWWGFHHGLEWQRRYAWLYRPVHYAYGVGARYSPYRAGFVRNAHAYGPYGGVGRAAFYDPRAKGWVRGPAAYGKRDGRLATAAYTPAARSYVRTRKATSVYGTWGGSAVARDDHWAATQRREQSARTAAKAEAAGLKPARGRADDTFVGRDGRIYRRNDGAWQVRTMKGWNAYDPNRRPAKEAKPKVEHRQVHRDLERQAQARERGHAQTQRYQRTRAQPPSYHRSSGYRRTGGVRRGGGGRRR